MFKCFDNFFLGYIKEIINLQVYISFSSYYSIFKLILINLVKNYKSNSNKKLFRTDKMYRTIS